MDAQILRELETAAQILLVGLASVFIDYISFLFFFFLVFFLFNLWLMKFSPCLYLFQAPPNLVTNEQRHAAEAVFMNFRKTKSPYILCKHILGKCANNVLLSFCSALVPGEVLKIDRCKMSNFLRVLVMW